MNVPHPFRCFAPVLIAFCMTGSLVQAEIMISHTVTTMSGNYAISPQATDFYIFNSSSGVEATRVITRLGNESLFDFTSNATTAVRPGQFYSVNNLAEFSWTNGTPIASGTTNETDYYYINSAQSSGDSYATYLDISATVPETEGTLSIWMYANGNSSTISFDASVLLPGNQTESLGSESGSGWRLYEIDFEGLTANDTVTFRLNNFSSGNDWANINLLAAELMVIPEPGSLVLGGIFLATAWMLLRRRIRA